jgi:hypothetical protein
MTASTAIVTLNNPALQESAPASPSKTTNASCLKSVSPHHSKEAAIVKRNAFSRFRSLSNSFGSQKRSLKSVRFALTDDKDDHDAPLNITIHELPGDRGLNDETTRALLWLTYQDKVTIADDVEEICYAYYSDDYVHPYIQKLDHVWDQCVTGKANHSDVDIDTVEAQFFTDLVNTKGRGLEKKLIKEMKRNREQVVKQVVDAQRSYKNLPVGQEQRSKMLKNKYKKLSQPSKTFAQLLAQGDAQVAAHYLHHHTKVAAHSA